MISTGEVIFPLIIEIMIIAAIIYNCREKTVGNVPILGKLAIGMFLLINCVFAADAVYFLGSLTGLYDLPVKSGRMANVRIVDKLGGESLFDIFATEFKISNNYDELLREDDHYKVTYVPITHRVVKLERKNK